MPYLAWATRGLVELAIWTQYCSRSPDNARRFIQDTVRDHVGLLCALGLSDPEDAETDELRKELDRVAESLGMNEVEGKFTRVSAAARQIGMLDSFINVNTALSKFVHPTALVTNTPMLDEVIDVFSSKFIQMADLAAATVFRTIRREQKTFLGQKPTCRY